jgi:nucleotide-binding universal stress UspA family protein
MKTILAPVDFSPVSIHAARYAASMASDLQSELFLLHVVQMPVVYGDVPMPAGNYDVLLDQAKVAMHDLVLSLKREITDMPMLHTEVKAGSPVYEIMAISDANQPLMVVMSTRGLGSVERFLLGSTTLSTIKECSVPVLVIPEYYNYKPIRKIGLASDLKNVVERTPDKYIEQLTQLLSADLHIIHNNANYHEYEPAVMEEEVLMDTMFQRVNHRFHFLHKDYTEESIVHFAKENDLGWLMVIPEKQGFFDSLFAHQHTREFVLHATLPILVLTSCEPAIF